MESNQHATSEALSLDSTITSRRFADAGPYLVEVVDAVVAQASNRTTTTSTGYLTTEATEPTSADSPEAFEALRLAAVHQRAVDLISEMCAENASYVRSAGRLTAVTSTKPHTQGKRLSKAPDGSIRKEQPDNLREGVARLEFFEDEDDLIEILASLTDADAISPQVPKTDLHPVRLATIKAAAADPYAHTRSKSDFTPNEGRGVVVVDRGGPVRLDRRSGLLSGALPVRGGCPRSGLVLTFEYFIRTGTSSVEFVGEGLRGGKVVRLFHGKRPGARSASSTNPRSLPFVFHAASGISSPSAPK